MTEKDTFNLRNILKSVSSLAVAGGVSFALSGNVAAASNTQLEAIEPYTDPETFETVLTSNADDVIEALSVKGYIDAEAALKELGGDPTDGSTAVDLAAIEEDGEAFALLMLEIDTNDGAVSIYARPDSEKGYAFVESGGKIVDSVFSSNLPSTVTEDTISMSTSGCSPNGTACNYKESCYDLETNPRGEASFYYLECSPRYEGEEGWYFDSCGC